MAQKPQETVEIRVSVLKGVLKIGNSILTKVDSLLKGHYTNGFVFSDYDLTSLVDVRASSYTLISYLQDLIDQAHDAQVKHVYLPPEELKVIVTLTNALTITQMAKVASTNLREH